jgi:hypothetical protein
MASAAKKRTRPLANGDVDPSRNQHAYGANGGDGEWVSGYKLATHIGLSRAAVDQMTAQGIFTRGPEGRFNLSQSRLAYIAHLRKNRHSSAHQAAMVAYAPQRTEWLRQRVQRNAGETITLTKHCELMDVGIGTVLTELSSLSGIIGGHDLMLRRKVDAAVIQMRRRLAEAFTRLADQAGEPKD